jgi:hypothetical protein
VYSSERSERVRVDFHDFLCGATMNHGILSR